MVDHTIQGLNVGCEDLFNRIMEVQPKIHVCGHIHWAYGQKSFHGVEFLNASVLNERYQYENKPIVIEYNPETKEIDYL
jgi:Icc-related predicted phosphoesterase